MRINYGVFLIAAASLLTMTVEAMLLRSRNELEQQRNLQEVEDVEYNTTLAPSISYNPSPAPSFISTNTSEGNESSSSSNSSKNGISSLEFAIGFIILAMSCAVVACIAATIKTNTSCYEDQLAGKEFSDEFEDSLNDSTHSADGATNPMSLAGLHRDRPHKKFLHSTGSGGDGSGMLKRGTQTTSRHSGGGPEFVKLQHFEQSDGAGGARGHTANHDGEEGEGQDLVSGGARGSKSGQNAHKRISTR